MQSFAELGVVGGVTLLVLVFVSLRVLVLKYVLNQYAEGRREAGLVLALFFAFLLADQIYGNYFMMVGTCLMLGISARMQVANKKECAVYA